MPETSEQIEAGLKSLAAAKRHLGAAQDIFFRLGKLSLCEDCMKVEQSIVVVSKTATQALAVENRETRVMRKD